MPAASLFSPVPAAQLFCGLIEKGLNTLLELDPDSQGALQKLKGKRLLISLNEFSFDFLIVASQQMDVLSIERAGTSDAPETPKSVTLESADCFLKTSLFTLPQLRETNQITRLIKEDKLQLEGDIHLAQAFSELFSQLHIDWEEQLARHTGDVLAHEVFRFGKNLFNKAEAFRKSLQQTFSEAAIEEKQIAVAKTLTEDFTEQVNELQARTEQLESRLLKFEHQLQGRR